MYIHNVFRNFIYIIQLSHMSRDSVLYKHRRNIPCLYIYDCIYVYTCQRTECILKPTLIMIMHARGF